MIVNVETTPATTPDDNMIEVVRQVGEGAGSAPGEHTVDKATDSKVLVASPSEYGVTIVGPVAKDPGWQARAGAGYDKGSIAVHWDRRVTCRRARRASPWLPTPTRRTAWSSRRFAERLHAVSLSAAVHAVEAETADHRAAARAGQHEAPQAARH